MVASLMTLYAGSPFNQHHVPSASLQNATTVALARACKNDTAVWTNYTAIIPASALNMTTSWHRHSATQLETSYFYLSMKTDHLGKHKNPTAVPRESKYTCTADELRDGKWDVFAVLGIVIVLWSSAFIVGSCLGNCCGCCSNETIVLPNANETEDGDKDGNGQSVGTTGAAGPAGTSQWLDGAADEREHLTSGEDRV